MSPREARAGTASEVAGAFLKLGLTSFGGPIAHLGYFHQEFVVRRRWLDEHQFGRLLALCQFLPGPASSQLGFALGLLRAGWAGAFAAFLAFTLPSALLMFAFAAASHQLDGPWGQAAVHGLKLVALAVVAHAVTTMARTLTPDSTRLAMAAVAATIALAWGNSAVQLMLVAAGAVAGRWLCSRVSVPSGAHFALPYGRRTGGLILSVFGMLLVFALFVAPTLSPTGQVAGAFFQSGALVFGGGHVVLPLLQEAVVVPGWISEDSFLMGYGAAQAVPGPMFALSAFLGAQMSDGAGGAGGAGIALLAIFLPGLLLAAGALPFWHALGKRPGAAGMVAGVNAVVVGLLAAALYDPLWTGGVRHGWDALVAGGAFVLLSVARWPALPVLGFCVAASLLMAGMPAGLA